MHLSQVHRLQLEITSRCNAHCPHCPRYSPDGDLHPTLQLSEWDVDLVHQNLEITSLVNLRAVVLEGDRGDPLMHTRIWDIIEFFVLAAPRARIRVITNGSIRNPQWWKKLGQRKFDNLQVTFSIDGLEDTNHYYRVGLDFHKIMANAKSFIDNGGRARWKCLIFRHNEHQIPSIIERAESMGFECVDFIYPDSARFTPTWWDPDREWTWPIRQQGEIVDYLALPKMPPAAVEAHSQIFRPVFPLLIPISEQNKICPNLDKGHIYVSHRHHVIPCCMMHNHLYESSEFIDGQRLKDLIGDIDQVDISKRSLSQVLQADFFTNDLDQHLRKKDRLDICQTSCGSKIRTKLQQC